jgi:hypothetical protein
MKSGDRIRVTTYIMGYESGFEDYTVEEFRYCLGIFQSPQHRQAGNFTPLCELFERGPDSENSYISNYGEYVTNMVQGWSDIP